MPGTIMLANTFEGGTNGTDITGGASGGTSGNAFNATNATGGATKTFTNVTKFVGSFAAQFAPGTGSTGLSWTTSITGTPANTAVRFYVNFSSMTTAANAPIFYAYTDVGMTTLGWAVRVRTDGKIELLNGASASVAVPSTVLVANTWYRIEANVIAGTSGKIALYAGHSTTALSSATASTFAAFTGINACRTGCITGSTLNTFYVDDLAFGTGDYLGPSVTLTPPTAAFTITGAGTAITLDASGSSFAAPATSIASYSWDFGDGNTGSGVNPSYTYAAPGTYSIVLTVTDNNGLTGTVSHSWVAKAASSTSHLSTLTVATGWTNVGGASDLIAALSDGLATTWALSPGNPTSAVLKGFLDPLLTPGAGTAVSVNYIADRISSASGTILAKLYEGATLRSTTAPATLAAGTDPNPVTGTATCTIPAVDAATVTAWANGTLLLQTEVTVA
jgi:PKD repeat protein